MFITFKIKICDTEFFNDYPWKAGWIIVWIDSLYSCWTLLILLTYEEAASLILIRKYNSDNVLQARTVLCNVSSQLQSLSGNQICRATSPGDEGETMHLYIQVSVYPIWTFSSTRKTCNFMIIFSFCFHFCIKCFLSNIVGRGY